jgi:predicted DNA-binding transcriptional regulator YafY
MRADRLLSLMFLLQTRGKATAQILARELGVSRRTILRDVEALSIAGVPVYSDGGHGGGIALDDHYRTTLTGLHTAEVRTLFIANNASVLRDLGLQEASERLLLKLLAALPTAHHPTADHVRQRLMVDPAWWWHDPQMPTFWDDLRRAVYDDRLIQTIYENYAGDVVERTLAPYSLVNKSGLWYLVAEREDVFHIYRVSRFQQVQVLESTFTRRADYDLPTYWQEHLQSFVERFSEYRCTLRIHPERLGFIKWLTPGRWQVLGEAGADGWLTIRIVLDSPVLAKMLVFGLGNQSEVIDPPELAGAVLQEAEDLVQHLKRLKGDS